MNIQNIQSNVGIFFFFFTDNRHMRKQRRKRKHLNANLISFPELRLVLESLFSKPYQRRIQAQDVSYHSPVPSNTPALSTFTTLSESTVCLDFFQLISSAWPFFTWWADVIWIISAGSSDLREGRKSQGRVIESWHM